MISIYRCAIIILLAMQSASTQPSVRLELGHSTMKNIYFSEISLVYKGRLPIKTIDVRGEIYGGYLTWMAAGASMSPLDMEPFEDTYRIGGKLTCKNIFLRFEHFCNHPVVSSSTHIVDALGGKTLYTELDVSPYWWFGTVETISIGVEYTFK